LRPLDKVLLVTLVSVWAVCFALHVETVARGRLPSLRLLEVWVATDSAQAYPRVRGFRPGAEVWPRALQVGDELLSAGGTDLRGVGSVGFLSRALERADSDLRLNLAIRRDGEIRELELPIRPHSQPWRFTVFSFGLVAVAVLVLLRARRSRAIRPFFLGVVWYGVMWCPFPGGPPEQTYAWVAIRCLAGMLSYPFLLQAILLFPEEAALRSRGVLASTWLFALIGPTWAGLSFGILLPQEIGLHVNPALGAAHNLCAVAAITRNYRHSGPIGRRQLRWVVYGLYLALAPVLVNVALVAIRPELWWLYDVTWNALYFIPICVLIAILRYNLADIDRLISATAAYTALAVVFLAAVLAGIPRLAQAASELAGIDPSSGQIALSVALAVLLVPIQRCLRPQIDRLFFMERYLLDRGIAELLPALSECLDARELIQRAGDGIHRLLRPESCVVYSGSDGSYSPVYVQGRAVPPAFEGTSPLVAALRERREPLALGDAGRRPDAAPLGPFDRAALETLDAELIAPVRHGEMLLAFLCLGPKRSGDVYTSTDVSHLAVVAEKVSASMLLFDQEEVIRQGRVMQESLRRYVPGAVAEQLASGGELESGEREVTVLFVDLRGYTRFFEGRPPTEVFSTVNRYTEVVSAVVTHHGGAVLEFNGDGMMAVFGAPGTLLAKERAALDAGRQILLEVSSLAAPERLSVGIGIATGEDFVGNVNSVDRFVWTVIGNTTNLAARLQALTRQLDAGIVTDEATWRAGGAAATGFTRHERVHIRGRSDRIDVYVLPWAPAPPPVTRQS
jgi:class 3 adenylate cyclase